MNGNKSDWIGNDWIESEGYELVYERKNNRIVILLPQTV